jgi:hypothetical protein
VYKCNRIPKVICSRKAVFEYVKKFSDASVVAGHLRSLDIDILYYTRDVAQSGSDKYVKMRVALFDSGYITEFEFNGDDYQSDIREVRFT